MLSSNALVKLIALLGSLLALTLVAAACGGGPEKSVIKFHDGQW